jgi:hypothetical protein
VLPVLERRAAALAPRRQRLGVDVDHHLVAVAARARIEPAGERALGDQPERVGAALLGGGVLAGRVARPACGSRTASPRRVERPQQRRPGLRRQPPAHHHHPVLVGVGGERPAGLPPLLVLHLLDPVHPPPAPHQPLDVRRRPGPREVEQFLPRWRRWRPASSPAPSNTRSRPFFIDAEMRGSPASARATRTFSRAAPRSSPVRQLSQCAQERQPPSFQPFRSSNSRIITRSWYVAAWMWAESSAIRSPSKVRPSSSFSAHPNPWIFSVLSRRQRPPKLPPRRRAVPERTRSCGDERQRGRERVLSGGMRLRPGEPPRKLSSPAGGSNSGPSLRWQGTGHFRGNAGRACRARSDATGRAPAAGRLARRGDAAVCARRQRAPRRCRASSPRIAERSPSPRSSQPLDAAVRVEETVDRLLRQPGHRPPLEPLEVEERFDLISPQPRRVHLRRRQRIARPVRLPPLSSAAETRVCCWSVLS